MERTQQAPAHAETIAALEDEPRGCCKAHARPEDARAHHAPARPETPTAPSVDRSAPSSGASAIATSSTPRRHANTEDLEDRILGALSIVAELLEHDEAYVPVFTRLEEELTRVQAQRAALSRARAYLRTRR
jgi:hypothetical protein